MSDPIRVVHIVRPGAEELREHVVGLCSGLSAHRVEAVVVGPLERPFREALSRRDVRWVNIPLPAGLRPREQYAAVTHLARFLQAAPPSIIHAHGFQAAYTALAARRRLSVSPPLIVAPHGVPALHDRSRPEQALRRFGYRRALASADAVVGADSAIVHLAAALGVPAVALFSGTNRSRQWRPRGKKITVLRHRTPCMPCHLEHCPMPEHACMKGIFPKAVFEAVVAAIQPTETTPVPKPASGPRPIILSH